LAFGNIIGYCKILLDPANQEKMSRQIDESGVDSNTDQDQIRRLPVKAVGLNTLILERINLLVQAEKQN
jgi:hypothetical protein